MADRPVLLIGKSGMLGRAWRQWLEAQGVPHLDVDFPDFDLGSDDSIARQIDGSHPLVINCAAFTDVDGCEQADKFALAQRINGTGVGALARRCAAVGALLVHYSTDYVFDGQAAVPYRIDQPRRPLNAYGQSKALGEELLESSGANYLLIRTSWLYAPWANNFVRTIARLAQAKPSLKVVHDQRGRPTSAEHLAATTWRLAQAQARGTFHVTDGGECTWFDFAARIAAWANPACPVEPCTSDQFPRPARRPAYSVLDLSPVEKILGPMPHWHANLDDVLARLEPL